MRDSNGGELVEVVHAGIPGRARLRVAGLHHSPGLQGRLERDLAPLHGLGRIEASTATGNLLVHYNAKVVSLHAVAACVAAVVRGDILVQEEDAGLGQHDAPDWHIRSTADAAAALDTSANTGLSAAAADDRLARVGANCIEQVPRRTGLEILREQFQSLPVGLLAGAAVLSVATGGFFEAAAILAVVGLNGIIGYGVESRSERTISSLAAAGHQTTWVVRDGTAGEIGLEAVVPGDLISLRRGTLVPADARIISAQDLTIGEALLTGESLPVSKMADPLPRRAVPLADRVNMVYRGTVVTGGSGMAVVTATGPHTEMGRIQRLLGEAASPETPMQCDLGQIGRQLVWISLGVCGVVFGIGVLRGFAVLQMFRSAISLAVAAVPEGLPAIATTTLALGVEEMRRRDVLVRRLDAVETLASVQVICFDKTGTLTLNRMTVVVIATGRGERPLRVGPGGTLLDDSSRAGGSPMDEAFARLLQIGILCSETQIEEAAVGRPALNGSATENALVQLALDLGVDAAGMRGGCPRLSIRHRTEAYRFMVTTHRQPGEQEILVAVKGSPTEVLGRCAWWLDGGQQRALTASDRAAIEQANVALAGEALRVLGFAYKCASEEEAGVQATATEGLTWIGLAAMADPVRPGIASLMRILQEAGIHSLIMTGDQAQTARAVAGQLGLNGTAEVGVLDAADLNGMSDEQLGAVAQRVHVLARVSPVQKLRVIRALQQAGVVVAMIGDGINDSPALKAANVGVAMGSEGTNAAREVADVVLQTDDLTALSRAVAYGRSTYTNVRQSIRYLLGSNFSEVGVMLTATAAGFSEPLTVPQLLWINLVTDVLPALGLALESPAPDLMQRPPRSPDNGVLGGADLTRVAAEGGVITAGGLLACGWGVLRYGVSAEARTMTFGSLVTAQLLHALNCRSAELAGVSGHPSNRALTGALAASFALQVGGMLVPGLRKFLGIAPLSLLDTGIMLGAGVLPFFANRALQTTRTGPHSRGDRRTPMCGITESRLPEARST
jgi:P-type Ca2+ transporter type 2C